jgi:hypothetical protein
LVSTDFFVDPEKSKMSQKSKLFKMHQKAFRRLLEASRKLLGSFPGLSGAEERVSSAVLRCGQKQLERRGSADPTPA